MNDPNPDRHRLHMGIAEAGKLLAVNGRHKEALNRYREALRLAHSAQAPQLFGRHYLQCVLESLEHLSDHVNVQDLAGRAADAAAEAGDTPFHRRDRASLLERVGVAQLKAGLRAEAEATLQQVIELAGPEGQPLSALLLDWMKRGFEISPGRLAEAQRRHAYWAVRPDTVDATRAIDVPVSSREIFHGG
ncbi:peptidylprolyl isomerase [Sphingomonas parva]|uniref:Peptidylprolyl isomerase n=1 Tax=Sphingomonas parva TaxID=2555898 RepID=A0A4Y8ZU92_9SPHN|nr:peptidylprolyl isomerase [Sphingomonas parva]TFI59037.1 peptidylprolyl isomerase [Sphingomonas parva]